MVAMRSLGTAVALRPVTRIQGDPAMAQPERYVFVCLNQRPEGHPKGSCLDRGAAGVFEALREEQGRRLLTNVKVVATGCMEACLAGPALLVVPDNVWYGGVTEADVPELSSATWSVGTGRAAADRSR